MWIVNVKLENTPERMAARPAHRAVLTELHAAGIVRMAGPLADDTAALVIIDAPDRQTVEKLLAADPYYTTAGVTLVSLSEWSPFLV